MKTIWQHPKSGQWHIKNEQGEFLNGYPGDNSFKPSLFGAFSSNTFEGAADKLVSLETVRGTGWEYKPYPQTKPFVM